MSLAATDRRSCGFATAAFFAAVIAEILYVLAFDPFATVDTAAHLASARGTADFVRGPSASAARLLEWNPMPAVPNMLPQLALVVLVPLASAHLAERLMLLGYVLAISFAMLWALRQTRPGATILAFFVLPLTFNLPFLWGFLNFSYSIAGFLLVAGLLLRWEARLDARRAMLLAFILVLVFFTHLVGLLESGLLALCMLGVAWLRDGRHLRGILLAVAALLPAAVLTAVFMMATRSGPGDTWIAFAPLARLAQLLALTASVVAYDQLERLACVATALALWGLALLAAPRWRSMWIARPATGGLAAFILLSSAVALLAPENVQGGATLGYIRYALFPVLGTILWLGCQTLRVRPSHAAAVVATASAVLIAAVRYDELRAMETALRDLRALEASFTPGATVLQLNLRRFKFGDATAARSFTQLSADAGRLPAARGGIDLGNVDWAMPFSLLRFRRDTNPYLHLVHPGRGLFGIEAAPPPVDLGGYLCRTAIPIDFVVLFGRVIPEGAFEPQRLRDRRAAAGSAELARFEADLTALFAPMTSSPLGLWELWGRRGAAMSAASACAEGIN